MSIFEEHGISLEYPDDWALTEESADGQLAISIESPGSAFWMLSVIKGRPSAEDVVAAALESFQREYDNRDVYESAEQICLLPTVACDIDFECVEMLNHAAFRACETDAATLFVMHQCPQTEESQFKNDLDRITDSLMWNSEDETGFDPLAYDNLTGLDS